MDEEAASIVADVIAGSGNVDAQGSARINGDSPLR
jgi:hypothetical protein